MPSRPQDRKLVFVQADIVDKLMEISNREGRTLSSFISDVLADVVRIYSDGGSMKDAVRSYTIASMHRSAGIMLTPVNLLNSILARIDRERLEEVYMDAYESGYWYGRYISVKFEDPVDALRSLLTSMLLSPVDVSIEGGGDHILFRFIASNLSSEATRLLLSIFEGVMSALGYETDRAEYTRGIVIAKFKKVGS
ncbi:MAG: hypothetical protein RMJ00_06780 [Nitrososphaerota archaeon]|nr:hypothetical protein [Candidatus Bathyarchaeota archaeon]MCX8161957.1 hypothetical protein [Candidatus Bathyarchaeota archaeon]MDW8062386.1 hypothetical protein [Nitrososphaerota archaeon]